MDFSLVSTSYIFEDDLAKVLLFTRDEYFRKVVFKVPFYPYFYLRPSDLGEAKAYLRKYTLENINHREKEEDLTNNDLPLDFYWDQMIHFSKERYQADFGDEVQKISCTVPRFVGDIRRILESKELKMRTYEADVLFHLRFLIDTGIKTGFTYNNGYLDINEISVEDIIPKEVETRVHIGFVDIEVLAERESQLDDASAPVIIVGVYDYTRKEGCQFTADKEEILLKNVVSHLKEKSFDLIASFTEFDMKFLMHRCQRLGIDISELSCVGKASISKDRITILGTEILDLALLHRELSGEPTWTTLDYVARTELGHGKYPLPNGVYNTWLSGERQEVLKYNETDVNLLVELEQKLGLVLGYADLIRREVGCNWGDIFSNTRIGDTLYLRLTHGKIVLMSRSPFPFQDYVGAEVIEVNPGLYLNILVLDWSEMYPSIIETLNIGWNTFRTLEEPDTFNIEGTVFSRVETSWTTIILKGLRKLRGEFKEAAKLEKDPEKKKLLRTKSFAFKTIINAVYGGYGFAGHTEYVRGKVVPYAKYAMHPSRFYNPTIAKSITLVGRLLLNETREYVEKKGLKIIYGDTDSIFIQVPSPDRSFCMDLARELQTHITKFSLERWNIKTPSFNIDFDKLFTRIIIPRKKRYHGFTDEGEEIIKGLEIIRKDVADITTEIQLEVGRKILRNEPREDTISYIRKTYQDVASGKLPVSKVIVKGRCTKLMDAYNTLPHQVKAMWIGNNLLHQGIKVGERFFWIYVLGRKSDGGLQTIFALEYLEPPAKKKRSKKKTIQTTFEGTVVDYIPKVKKYPLNIVGLRTQEIPSDFVIDWRRMANHVVFNPMKKYAEILQVSPEEFKRHHGRIDM